MLGYDEFAMTSDPAVGMPGRPSLGSAMGRRKAVWMIAAIVGLALGIGLYKEVPPPYKATTLVQIEVIPGVLPTDEALTEVALAQSRTVAERAMSMLRLPEDPKSVLSFIGQDTVAASTDQILAFTVKASSADDAVARVKALARAYLRVRASRLDSARRKTVRALDAAIAAQQKKLAALSARIATVQAETPSAGQQAQLTSLQATLRQAKPALKALEGAVQDYSLHSQLSNKKVERGSWPLDPAVATPRSKLKYPVLYAAGGLIAGLGIGMGWVIVSALVSARPRRRYDIARALGAPVRFSVGRIRVSGRAARRAPESAGGRGVQQIASYMRGSIRLEQGRASLAVVAADDCVVPALSVVSLALSCVREGKRVCLADLTPGAEAGRLLGCTEPGVHRQVAGQWQLTIAVPADSSAPPIGPVGRISAAALAHGADPELDHAYHDADLLLTLVTIDLGFGADHLRTWAREAIVMVTAGRPSATRVRTLAELIRLSGTTLTSAVVVGADVTDESLGLPASWDEDEQAGGAREPARGDVWLAQQNGSSGRGQASPGPAERDPAMSETRIDVRTEQNRSGRQDGPVRPEPGPQPDSAHHRP